MNTVYDDVRLASVTQPTVASAVELERLGDQIAEMSAHLDAATARLLDLIREFDDRGGWGNGFRSCAHWLTWRIGLDQGAARERVRVARALGSLPRLAKALARGELRIAVRSGSSHPPLGARRPDDAVEPGDAVAATPPVCPRRGLPTRTTAGWSAPFQAAGWPPTARRPASRCGADQSDRDASSAERQARRRHRRAHVDARLAGRAP